MSGQTHMHIKDLFCQRKFGEKLLKSAFAAML